MGSNPTPGIRRSSCQYSMRTCVRFKSSVAYKPSLTGLNDCAIGRLTGIPRSTVRDWRSGAALGSTAAAVASRDLVAAVRQCGHPATTSSGSTSRYAYLLGMYLGDGCLVAPPTRRLSADASCSMPTTQDIVAECAAGNARPCFRWQPPWPPAPARGAHAREVVDHLQAVGRACSRSTVPDRKHERLIRLTDWQQRVVERAPEPAASRTDPLRRLPLSSTRSVTGEDLRVSALQLHEPVR